MSLSEIATLKIFLSEQYGICDIQSNFQHIFRVLGALPQTLPGALCLYGPRWWRNLLFCPLRNKFLATPLVSGLVMSSNNEMIMHYKAYNCDNSLCRASQRREVITGPLLSGPTCNEPPWSFDRRQASRQEEQWQRRWVGRRTRRQHRRVQLVLSADELDSERRSSAAGARWRCASLDPNSSLSRTLDDTFTFNRLRAPAELLQHNARWLALIYNRIV